MGRIRRPTPPVGLQSNPALNWTDYGNYSSGRHVNVSFDGPFPSLLMGYVSTADVEYDAQHAAPTFEEADVPTEPLALTTELDLFNAVPDSDTDDIVNVDHDQSTFGDDTGSISLQLGRDLPQAVLPIDVDVDDTLPIHAYLAQGGFGSSATAIGTLRSDDVRSVEAD